MIWFALASLTPAVVLIFGAATGGIWPTLGVLCITVLVFVMDRLVTRMMPDTAGRNGTLVNLVQAFAHFVLWGMTIWAIAAPDHLSSANRVLLIIGVGLYFGQISNSNAHELIHAPNRVLKRIGIAIYCSVLFGHHTSAHMRVHHVHAATAQDPNSARLGEGFWRYLLRAWPEGFWAGKRAEDSLMMRKSKTNSVRRHPYIGYCAGAVLGCLFAFGLGGLGGILALLVLASYAQVQLYLSDYVQHYGLQRQTRADNRPEPMGPQHSWNAPHWYSSAMMMNAPRHSDHHANPARAFPDLRLEDPGMPMLPHSLPVMAVLALLPPVWRKVMDGRAMAWNRTITS